MLFEDSHIAEFDAPTSAAVIPSTSTPPPPQRVRREDDRMEGITLMGARNLEEDIQHAEISPELNIYTLQITQTDEHGMLYDTLHQEQQHKFLSVHRPNVEREIRMYVRRPRRSK